MKYAELIKIFTKSNQTIVNLLTNVQLGIADKNTEKLVQTGFKDQSYKNYPNDELYIYADHALTVLRNQIVWNNLTFEVYSIVYSILCHLNSMKSKTNKYTGA